MTNYHSNATQHKNSQPVKLNDSTNRNDDLFGISYGGEWDAMSNLTSKGTRLSEKNLQSNTLYLVSVSGNTSLFGESNWNKGDLILSSNGKLQKIPTSLPYMPLIKNYAMVNNFGWIFLEQSNLSPTLRSLSTNWSIDLPLTNSTSFNLIISLINGSNDSIGNFNLYVKYKNSINFNLVSSQNITSCLFSDGSSECTFSGSFFNLDKVRVEWIGSSISDETKITCSASF